MRHYTYTLLIISILFFFTSCMPKTKETELTFKQAKELLEEHPDSACALLEHIPSPNKLSPSMYNEYLLLHIQAKDKAYKDIACDTLIFQVKNYYLQRKDMGKATIAACYCGRVLKVRDNYTDAMNNYLEAESLAPQSIPENLKGLIQFGIADLYYSQYLQKEAVPYYKKAYWHFHRAGKYKNEASSLTAIADCFDEISQKDSAFYYFNQALTIAGLHNDSARMAVTRQNMGISSLRNAEYDKAIENFRYSISLDTRSERLAKYYYNLANTYDKKNLSDSTQYYINMAVQALEEYPDNAIQASVYRLISKLEEKNRNYKQALEYHKMYTKYLVETEMGKKKTLVLDVGEKYQIEQIQNEVHRQTIAKQYILLAFLLSLLVIGVLSFLYYQVKVKKREAVYEATQKIHQLQNMAKKQKEETKVTFKNILFDRFHVLSKAILLEDLFRANEIEREKSVVHKFNEVVYGQKEGLDWGKLYESMNKLNEGFVDRLRRKFPELEEDEIRICCLSYAGLDNTEISIVLKQRFNTIQVKKSGVRKKIGFPGHGNIAEYLDSVLK